MTTTRAKLAVKNIGKYRTEEQALLSANYSPSYAKSGLIKKTKGWNELMDKNLNDALLLKKHLEGLEATRINNSHTEPDKEIPDYQTRHKYLDSAYKLKGRYIDEEEDNTRPIIINMPLQVNQRFDINEPNRETERSNPEQEQI